MLNSSRNASSVTRSAQPLPACTPVLRQTTSHIAYAVNGVHPSAHNGPEHLVNANNNAVLAATLTAGAGVLNLAFETDKKASMKMPQPLKTTGLHRAPLSGGVKTATARYDLPTPSVAVRNLVEHARFGHLCTMMSGMHHRRAGYPFGTLIDFATDGAGLPLFCLSPLAIHARNIIEEPRASLVVQMPGWTGLANARVTIFGDVYQLPQEMQATAREIFISKHANDRKDRWVSGNFVYFRMNKIVDIYFVGGFGTVQWIDPAEYMAANPDEVVLENPNRILQLLNNTFADDLCNLLYPNATMDELNFISIDATGVDIRVRNGSEFSVERVGFDRRVHNIDEAMEAVKQVVSSLQAKQQQQQPV